MDMLVNSIVDRICGQTEIQTVLFESCTARVCKDLTGSHYVKYFKDVGDSMVLFESECSVYKRIGDIPDLSKYVPKFIGFDEDSKCIMIEKRGVDAIEFLNHNISEYLYEHWLSFLYNISDALYLLHENGIIHADVKPENVLFEIETNRWFLIDFAFSAYANDLKKYRRCNFGTVVYCSPHSVCNQYVDGVNRYKINDIYGFAMSALVLYGYEYEVVDFGMNTMHNIVHLISIYNGDISSIKVGMLPKGCLVDDRKILKLLVSIVLTQLDLSYRYLKWYDRKYRYEYLEKQNDITPLFPIDRGIIDYWNEFLFIIRNLKIK